MSSRKLPGPMLLMGALFALAACSGAPPPPPPPPAGPQATVLDDQLQALEKARAVEDTLQQGQDRTEAALEDAEKN